jgi:predicted nucleic acid-binding Zn ribbon protein
VLTQGFKTGAGPMWKVQNAVGTALASDGLYDPDAKEEVDEGEALSSTTPTDPKAPVLEIAGG